MTGVSVAQTLAPAAQLGPFGYLAGGAFLVGFLWETVADLQKFHFKNKNPDKCAPSCCPLYMRITFSHAMVAFCLLPPFP